MHRIRALALLGFFALVSIPWQLICLEHPFGHDHHAHQGPSPCEMRRQYKGDVPAWWPPMHCHHTVANTDAFQLPQEQALILHFELPAAAPFNLLTLQLPECTPRSSPPVSGPGSDSDPPFSSQTLRGPPSA
ncbi:MAG: hypothetical protein IT266_03415 [Saprospiraceae bacterium]|nr:hypothetical protein [Saprospiraceae bacterium]